jgi:hypothetical protein
MFSVCRVLTPKVTCVLPQRVQLLFFLDLRLRARGNRDTISPHLHFSSSSFYLSLVLSHPLSPQSLLLDHSSGSAVMLSHSIRGPSVATPSVQTTKLSHHCCTHIVFVQVGHMLSEA